MARDITPGSKEDLRLMWHVIGRWVQVLEYDDSVSPEVAGWVKTNFVPVLKAESIERQFSHPAGKSYSNTFGWIVGKVTKHEEATPVISVSYGDSDHEGFKETAIRVSLLTRRSDSWVEAEGWRFEQAERHGDGREAHPYAHAQAINGWFASSPTCLIHPPHTNGEECSGMDPKEGSSDSQVDAERRRRQAATHVSHPAFPLPTRTLTGLALGTVVSLYGRNESRAIVIHDPKLRVAGAAVRADIEVLGLHEG